MYDRYYYDNETYEDGLFKSPFIEEKYSQYSNKNGLVDYKTRLFEAEYKTIFRKIENITIRCFRCPLIPRIRLRFNLKNKSNNFIIQTNCDNRHEYIYENPIDFIDTYINYELDYKKCKFCQSKDNLIFYEDCQLILCENCKQKKNIYDNFNIYYYEPNELNIRDIYNYERNENRLNSQINLLELDKNCHFHHEPTEYLFNLCSKCILEENIEESFFSDELFEFPDKPIKIKDIPFFIFNEKEIELMKLKLNSLEKEINSLNIPYNLEIIQKNSIMMIYFTLSFMRSLINTYEEMIKNNFLNFNIIINLRRINIEDTYDLQKILTSHTYEFNQFPFYNISINKFFYNNISNDDFREKKYINLLEYKESFPSYPYLFYNENLFVDKQSLILKNELFDESKYDNNFIKLFDPLNSFHPSNEFDHNYTYKRGSGKFVIVFKYSNFMLYINQNKKYIIEYKDNKMNINKELNPILNFSLPLEIFQDKDGNIIYIKNQQSLILISKIFSKEQNKYIFNEDTFDLSLLLRENHAYKCSICNKNLYFINNNNHKLIQYNLFNSEKTEIYDETLDDRLYLLNLIDLNNDYILFFFSQDNKVNIYFF